MHGSRVASTLSRRHFILTAATAAGGFMIGIGATAGAAQAATVTAQPWNDDNATAANEIDAWIAIDPDDSILIRYQRSEMGQGSMTALPMMITEELQCDWSKVRIEYASANRNLRENKVYGPMFSHGSMSVRLSQKKMQQVGASARERLIAAAAARWNVPASECSAAQSVVTHKASGQSLRYGELAADAAKVTLASRAGDQDARSIHLHSASRCRGSTWSTRPTARQNSASTRKFRAWFSPRSRLARFPAAS